MASLVADPGLLASFTFPAWCAGIVLAGEILRVLVALACGLTILEVRLGIGPEWIRRRWLGVDWALLGVPLNLRVNPVCEHIDGYRWRTTLPILAAHLPVVIGLILILMAYVPREESGEYFDAAWLLGTMVFGLFRIQPFPLNNLYTNPPDLIRLVDAWTISSVTCGTRAFFNRFYVLALAGDIKGGRYWIAEAKLANPALTRSAQAIVFAGAYGREGDVEKGIAIAHRVATDPVNSPDLRAEALDMMATMTLLQSLSARWEEALGWIEEAKILAPDRISLEGTKGSLLCELGRFAEAAPLLEHLHQTSSGLMNRSVSLAYLALIATREGRESDATRLLGEAEAIAPDHVDVATLIARVKTLIAKG